jgi:hypothetical protein
MGNNTKVSASKFSKKREGSTLAKTRFRTTTNVLSSDETSPLTDAQKADLAAILSKAAQNGKINLPLS